MTTSRNSQQGTEQHDQAEVNVHGQQMSGASIQDVSAGEEDQAEAKPLPFSIPFSGMSASFSGQAEVGVSSISHKKGFL